MGRPPKEPDNLRSQVYQLRLTDSEREAYDRAASRAGKSLSEWMREWLSRAARKGPKGS